jgi:hypothetical protein
MLKELKDTMCKEVTEGKETTSRQVENIKKR